MKKSIPSTLMGIAGVHFVVAELSRRGLIALPTIRNTSGYDIIVTTPDGKEHANIQVKTSQRRVTFWPMPPSNKIHATTKDYYVLLRWIEKDRQFEGFMAKGREARSAVAMNEKRQWNSARQRRRRSVWPSIHVGGEWSKQETLWKRRWETWTL